MFKSNMNNHFETYDITDINNILENLKNKKNFKNNLIELIDFISWYEKEININIYNKPMYPLDYLKLKLKEFQLDDSFYLNNDDNSTESSIDDRPYNDDNSSESIFDDRPQNISLPLQCFWASLIGSVSGILIGEFLVSIINKDTKN